MPTPSNKSNNGLTQRIVYPAFNGGLNLSVPPESIERNELREAINVEYSPKTGSMRVRGGLRFLGFFDNDKLPDYIVSVGGSQFFSVTSGVIAEYDRHYENVYSIGGWVLEKIESFNMELLADLTSASAWGSFGPTAPTCIYAMEIEPEVFLLSFGHRLYKYTNFSALGEEIKTELPFYTLTRRLDNVRMIFNRDERIGVVEGDSNIHVSGIGDIANWEDETASDSQYTEVGYKDSMTIQAVVPLSQDLIIFKARNGTDRGKIYRLVGKDPQAWQVVEVAHNTSTFSQNSVQVVGNDVFYLSESGLNILSSVQAYGDVKMSTPDTKVNNALAPLLKQTAKMWNLQHRQQLWILPSQDSEYIWVFDYIRNIWTKFKFPIQNIMAISEGYATAGDHTIFVYIVTHDGMYALDDNATVDTFGLKETYLGEVYQSTKTQQIEGYMKLGTLTTGHQTLIKNVYASHNIPEGCSGELILGKFKMPFKGSHSRRQCLVRDWKIAPEIKMYGGGCSVSTLGLEMVEV